MNSIKKRIALFIARRKYFENACGTVNFNKFVSRSKSCLIVLPIKQTDLVPAMDVINHFRLNKKSVEVVYPNSVKIQLPEGVSDIIYSEEDISKLSLPKKDFLQKLTGNEYDIVIDLNLEDDFFSSMIARAAKGNFVIGFNKERADQFYNFQVANNKNNAEISYRNLLNSLLMF